MSQTSGSTLLQPGQKIKPLLNSSDVEKLLWEQFGMKTFKTISELNSYDDRNYFLEVEEYSDDFDVEQLSTAGYVLKITNSIDSKKPQLIDAQTEFMIFMHNQGFVVPVPIKDIYGNYKSFQMFGQEKDAGYIVRLLSYIPGDILRNVTCSPNMGYHIGKLAAEFDVAAQKFHHPAFETCESIWVLSNAPKLKAFLGAVEDDDRRNLVLSILKEFENDVISNVDKLPKGLIHGDLNEQNILVRQIANANSKDFEVFSIIDFNDANISCLMFEVAIAVTYCMLIASNIEESYTLGGHVIAGYMSKRKLTSLEWDIMKICIETRLCQSLVMGAYSHKQNPSNTYVLSTASKGWHLLTLLHEMDKETLYKTWHAISKQYGL